MLLLGVTLAGGRSTAQNIVLGILEESKGHYSGEPNYRDVRVVFQKRGETWQPFQSDCADQACLKTVASTYPGEVKWTIAFDGKNLGQVVSHVPSAFKFYSKVPVVPILQLQDFFNQMPAYIEDLRLIRKTFNNLSNNLQN